MANSTMRMWYTDNVSEASSAIPAASDAINSCLSQISEEDFYILNWEGELTGDWDSADTYDKYLEEFKQQMPHRYDGDAHGLLYDRGIVQGFSFSDNAVAGKSPHHLRNDTAPLFVVNADLVNYDKTVYKNIVMHEFLHAILDKSKAPEDGNDHSYGTQYHEGGNLYPTYTSPMLTGYTESYRGSNEKPSECCDQSSVNDANAHSGDLSSCTKSRAYMWTGYKY